MNIVEMIHKMSRSLRRQTPMRKGHRRHGGFRVIRVLDQEGPMDFSDLALRLDIRGSSLSEALDKLQEKDMITKTVNPQDKRKVVVELTETAKEKLANRNEHKDDQAQRIENALSGPEKEEFIRLATKIIDALQSESQ